MNKSRVAGLPQGLVLVALPLLAMLGAVTMAPLLPTIQASYRDVPHVDVLVPLLLTTPALCIALLSPLAGALSDRLGPRRVLVWSLAVYGISGTAPMYLQSLAAIFVSRLFVGVSEAGMVISSMALLAHYYAGDDRQKWFAYQNAILPLLGAVAIALSGKLGDFSWRASFVIYTIGLVYWLASLLVLFEVPHEVKTHGKFRLPPGRFLWAIIAVAVPGSIAFYVPPVELGYLLQLHGITAPSVGSNITGLSLVLGGLGALASRWMTHISFGRVLALAMATIGIGLLVMAGGHGPVIIGVGMTIAELGGGLMLATGCTFAVSIAPPADRGLFSAAWWFFYMLAQFAVPLLMTGLQAVIGGRQQAVWAAGVACFVSCSWLLLWRILRQAVVPHEAALARAAPAITD